MKALFFTTYTPNNQIFWKSLECTGVEVHPQRYEDRPYDQHGEYVDLAKQIVPDFIVCVGALDWGPGISNPIPKPDVLRRLRDVAPTILLCGDTADLAWWSTLDDYAAHECFNVIVSMDGAEYKDLVYPKLTPVDIRDYNPLPWGERPHLIGCNGGPGGERGHMIQVLNAATPGGVVTAPEMARFICGCKVIVNGPRNGTGNADHVKGRVVEAGFGGACLLERTNAATARWFIPGIDYVEYDDPDDGARKLEWIRMHDDEAREIAARMHTKVLMEHHPKVFWQDVMEKAGVRM